MIDNYIPVYDADGFDQHGYNRYGFDRNGYNKQGFDRFGYNSKGLDKDGYNKLGVDADGFNKRTGRNREGFDRNGYDVEGYNKQGYNKQGYDKQGYDKEGYNQQGFDHEGYDKKGYDIEGYNRTGYNKSGYDKQGFDKQGYDKNGFDHEGYNKNGYNKQGYDRDGYNRYGYDIEGFNKDGFDKAGFDREGFNKNGYNKQGYDRDGYNRFGYDVKGYNREGYNRDGYDREGFNKNGYDKQGYDRDGFSKEGFNKNGYDKNGYDKNGYDKYGYDQFGFNISGYDKDGYDQFGFDISGYDKNGFDINGFGKDGYDKDGYDKDGFNRDGFTIDGFTRESFDEDGYLPSGFNIFGYDREGFTINGIDKDGYNRDGYNVETGLNREGYDINGYNEDGINKYGYGRDGYHVTTGLDIHGFNRNGYDKDGYDKDGFNNEGFNRQGFDRDGYDKKGNYIGESLGELKPGLIIYHNRLGKCKVLSKNGRYFKVKTMLETNNTTLECVVKDFNKFFSYTKPSNIIDTEKSYDAKEFEKEEETLNLMYKYIANTYSKTLVNNLAAKHKIITTHKKYIDINYLINDGVIEYGSKFIQEYERLLYQIRQEPYFAKVKYNDKQILIGKNAIDNQVIDWADPLASKYYYQYEMYLGSNEIDINLVRNYTIYQNKLFGYIDKYNKKGIGNSENQYADVHLLKLIEANRNDKNVHNIIQTIQENQYKIMTQPLDENLVVLGCAGSGKTMIMYHRLRYLAYNNEKLKLENVYLISPTKLLELENNQLVKELNIDEANIVTDSEFMISLLENYYDGNYLLIDNNIENDNHNPNIIDISNINSANVILSRVKAVWNVGSNARMAFINAEEKKLNNAIDIVKNTINSNITIPGEKQNISTFNKTFEFYQNSIKELSELSKINLDAMVEYINKLEKTLPEVKKIFVIFDYLYSNGCFKPQQASGQPLMTESQETLFKSLPLERKITEIRKLSNELVAFFKNVDSKDLEGYVTNNATDAIGRIISKYNGSDREKLSYKLKLFKILTYKFDKNYVSFLIKQLSKIHNDCLEIISRKDMVYALYGNRHLSGVIKSNNNIIKRNVIEALKATYNLFNLFSFERNKIKDVFKLGNCINDPLSFFDKYNEICEQLQRLEKFKNGSNLAYLFDVIKAKTRLNSNIFDYQGIKYRSELAMNLFVCSNLFNPRTQGQKLLFFDEFQDMPPVEFLAIKRAMPKAIINCFGDLHQCINPAGIGSEEIKNSLFEDFSTFQIEVNYRNASQITKYANEVFKMKMIEVGFEGVCKECGISELVDREYKKQDKIAYIVKNKQQCKTDDLAKLNIDVEWYKKAADILPLGRPVLYEIQDVKGLEFDVVIVDDSDMTDNEKYVAYTRALNELYVLRNVN